MSGSHDVKDFQTRSYRFSGYRLTRDLNNNIIRSNHKNYEPEYWKTRAISRPEGGQYYESLRKSNA